MPQFRKQEQNKDISSAHPGAPFGSPVTFDPTLPGGGQPVPGVPGKRDPNIVVKLDNKELWERFHAIGTEMIITKSGR